MSFESVWYMFTLRVHHSGLESKNFALIFLLINLVRVPL